MGPQGPWAPRGLPEGLEAPVGPWGGALGAPGPPLGPPGAPWAPLGPLGPPRAPQRSGGPSPTFLEKVGPEARKLVRRPPAGRPPPEAWGPAWQFVITYGNSLLRMAIRYCVWQFVITYGNSLLVVCNYYWSGAAFPEASEAPVGPAAPLWAPASSPPVRRRASRAMYVNPGSEVGPGDRCLCGFCTETGVRVRVRVRAARGKVWTRRCLPTHPRSLPRAAG